jgi:hypothetical protein
MGVWLSESKYKSITFFSLQTAVLYISQAQGGTNRKQTIERLTGLKSYEAGRGFRFDGFIVFFEDILQLSSPLTGRIDLSHLQLYPSMTSTALVAKKQGYT